MNNVTYYYSHGFNVLDGGERTLNTLRAYFYAQLGGTHIDLDYGWSGLASVSICNNRLARSYAEVITAPAVFVGHSNGCAIQAQAIEHGAKVRGCVWVAPAMPHDWMPPKHIRFIHVYYDPSDIPIAAGAPLGGLQRIVRRLWHKNPRSPRLITWGLAGRRGLTRAPQATNVQTTGGHSGVFANLQHEGPHMAQRLRDELGGRALPIMPPIVGAGEG